MSPLFAIALAAALPPPVDHPKTYLMSVERIPLRADESMFAFEIDTWGVEFKAVCHVPGGWWIEAGRSATPEGSLKGRGSVGATWFRQTSPSELHNLVLVTLYGPIQRTDIGDVPATFKGRAKINGMDDERTIQLTSANVRLVPAGRCPNAR